jgi:hypothetical protein
MSEIKHTPGPWQAADDHVFNEIGILIPTIYGSNDDSIKANAHLIAAAPDLLEALQVIIGDIEQSPRRFSADQKVAIARAAIAKATAA